MPMNIRNSMLVVLCSVLVCKTMPAQAATLHATSSNLSAQLIVAASGETIALAPGTYVMPQTSGISAVTLTADPTTGGTPGNVKIAALSSPLQNVTFDHVTIDGGTVSG